jgi:hypothetical protein
MANTSLIGKIAALFKREEASPQNPPETDNRKSSTETSPGDVSRAFNNLSNRWNADPDRLSTWLDIENMDANDEIVSEALDVLAEAATGKLDDSTVEAFYFSSENTEVLEILNKMTARLGLKDNATDICRKMIKHGNEFREIIAAPYQGGWKIVRLKEDLPSWQFISNRDQYGNVDSEFPWFQRTNGLNVDQDSLKFRSWQLAHFHYGEMKNGVAIPKLKSARRNWKRLVTVEDSMAHARIKCAYSKLIHRVPVELKDDPDTQASKIKKYKDLIQKLPFLSWVTGRKETLENPLTVETDFYLPDDGSGRGSIDTIDPKNNQLSAINDVNYALNRLISRMGVTRKYLNIPEDGGKMNAGAGDNEEKQFARKVRNIQQSFKSGLRFICFLELILHGKDPMAAENAFIIGMAEVNSEDKYRDAQTNQTNATAAAEWRDMFDIPEQLYMRKFMRLSDYEIKQFGPLIKQREWTAPTPNDGGAPKGQRPGSSDNNGKPKPRRQDIAVLPTNL